ncbi:MAG: NAD(P)H-dependent oxidoreductase [Muribaculaceae bacterium]|nr:NAD(P)H-dependent oxidoreductase [Muribaculaceae bacterium]
MRRFLLILIAVMIQFATVASAKGAGELRTLVVYYSYSGVTQSLAQSIASTCNGELLEVVDHGNYPRPESQTTYSYANEERRQIDNGVWPQINTAVESFDAWDAVIICTPLWNGKMANPMLTFLHNHAEKLAGKQVALVVTSYSSGISNVVVDAHNILPEATFVGNPLHIDRNGRTSMAQTAATWLETLDFELEESPTASKMRVIVGDKVFKASLVDNATTEYLVDLLPLTMTMSELNGNEKYYYLSDVLPKDATNPGTIHAGDIMLYGNSCVVLFYKTFNTSYSYTRIGAIDDPTGLAEALGSGSVEVRFEMVEPLEGDINGDGEVNISDVTSLVSLILEDSGDTFYPSNIDVNGDRELNISDVTALISLILSL